MNDVEQLSPLEEKALALPSQARAIKISDQTSYEAAVDKLQGYVALRKEITTHHEKMKKAAHAAWQATIAAEKQLLQPVAEAEFILKAEIGRYTIEQEQIRREEERRLREAEEQRQREAEAEQRRRQEEADRQHAEQLEQQIEQAEANGADPEYVDQLITQPPPVVEAPPVFMPPPSVPSRVARVKGVSSREAWVIEVTSLRQLAAEVGNGRIAENVLINLNYDVKTGRLSSPALNKIAGPLATSMKIAGVRTFPITIVSARGK